MNRDIMATMKKKCLLIAVGIFLVLGLAGFAFLVGVGLTEVQYKNTPIRYSGQELFDAVNTYRKENGLAELTISQKLCDNLVERWLAVSEPNAGHKNLEEWIEKEEIDKDYPLVGELYILDSLETKNAIEFWSGSPGHRTTLLDIRFNEGCAYASEKNKKMVGVVILGVREK